MRCRIGPPFRAQVPNWIKESPIRVVSKDAAPSRAAFASAMECAWQAKRWPLRCLRRCGIVERSAMWEPTTEMLGTAACVWVRGTGDEVLAAAAETILFVEDEAFVRDVTCEVLRSAGYRVLAARNAAEAVGIYEARGGEVELLLSDVVLPGETGPAMARRLRREHPELKVLLVTGYAEQMGLLEGKQEEFLAKPFSTEALLRKVRQVLDLRGLPTGTEESAQARLR